MLRFQVAGSDGGYLLEHLLIESIGAVRGGAIFAWANVGGIRSLLEDEVFDEFLTHGNFRLFVGTDSITDPPAIGRLVRLSTKYPRLDARAFMSPTASLFHPKLAWFEHDGYLSLVVGSGNLTMGGLRSNWEAFVTLRLSGDDRAAALAQIEEFLTGVATCLLPIGDHRVLKQAERNSGNERSIRSVSGGPALTEDLSLSVDEVLIADMNRTVNRLAQANFKLKDYEGFFGARRGTQRRISLRLVGSSGIAGEVQSRPSVEAKSKNYRFELDGLKAAHASTIGRPIGVFLRLATGEFLYSLVTPENQAFAGLDAVLATRSAEPAKQLRRIRVTAQDLANAWPSSPLLRTSMPDL